MPRKPAFPIRYESKPGKTRLQWALITSSLLLFCYWIRKEIIAPWVFLVCALVTLLRCLRGQHYFFSFDHEAIAWSYNLKRKPLTRVLLADLREVQFYQTDETKSSETLVLIDHAGASHIVGTLNLPDNVQIWRELRRLCPAVKFSDCRGQLSTPFPVTWKSVKEEVW